MKLGLVRDHEAAGGPGLEDLTTREVELSLGASVHARLTPSGGCSTS
jgi:hypothetical protein